MLGWMHRLAHDDWPTPDARPGAQFEHVVAPAAEYVPAKQSTQAVEAVAPVVALALPAPQAVAPPAVPTAPLPVQ